MENKLEFSAKLRIKSDENFNKKVCFLQAVKTNLVKMHETETPNINAKSETQKVQLLKETHNLSFGNRNRKMLNTYTINNNRNAKLE